MILMTQTIEAVVRPEGTMPLTGMKEIMDAVMRKPELAIPGADGISRRQSYMEALLAENNMLESRGAKAFAYDPPVQRSLASKEERATSWGNSPVWTFPEDVRAAYCKPKMDYEDKSLKLKGSVQEVMLYRILDMPPLVTAETGPAIYALFNCTMKDGKFTTSQLKYESVLDRMLRSEVAGEGDDILPLMEAVLWNGIAHKVWPYLMPAVHNAGASSFLEKTGMRHSTFGWTGDKPGHVVSDREIKDVIAYARSKAHEGVRWVDPVSGSGSSVVSQL